MKPFFVSQNCIKFGTYVLEGESSQGKNNLFLLQSNLLKWYNVKMSYEEKYRYGLLTYPEYLEWMNELAKQDSSPSADEGVSAKSNTFWRNDEGIRENISEDDYAKFLEENCINVSNTTTLNMEDLFSSALDELTKDPEEATPTQPADTETNLDEVLANVNKDMHGGDAILTQEEIAALFAAAGV